MGVQVSTCDKCGQALPDSINPFNLIELRNALTASNFSWEYIDVDNILNIEGLPAGATAKAIAAETNDEYDSYGEASGYGYVVFQIEYEGIVKTYKVDGNMTSYSGWSWNEEYVTEVSGQPKIVAIWESV